MSERLPSRPSVEQLTDAILQSYREHEHTCHIAADPLPERRAAIEFIELMRDVVFPGYYSPYALTNENVSDHLQQRIAEVRTLLEQQIRRAISFQVLRSESAEHVATPDQLALQLTDAFLQKVPAIRAALALDVQAAFDGDPAARSTDETIFCYPGIDAVFTYRVAHCLHTLGVPLLPRMMSEYVHNETGIDIHPAARIGKSFFIDHGTGVVIGETCLIGDRVKIYQGVTLGAISFPRDSAGRLIRGAKRHPTIEDDVTIYANAIILGGNTIIGTGSIIGGSVFITKSVPPKHYVTLRSQHLKYRSSEVHDRLAYLPMHAAESDGNASEDES